MKSAWPTPDEQAMFRIDFRAWCAGHSDRDRRIIDDMARNERTCDLARKYGVSPAAISQRRDRYRGSWMRFSEGEGEKRTSA
jgi:hypothetical protein